jgi:hypothetical protein
MNTILVVAGERDYVQAKGLATMNERLNGYQSFNVVGKEIPMISRPQFDVFRSWIKVQFKDLCPDQDADALNLHLLVRTQGLAVMSHVYKDKKLVLREVESIEAWLDSFGS